MSVSDPLRELLDKAVEGDDRALAELVHRTQVDLWKLCAALGSKGEEEDLVQETYLRAIRSIGSFRGDSAVRSWLYAIARNVCADHVRRRVRDRNLIDRIALRGVAASSPAPELRDELLDTLSPERRDAFALTQVLDLSYDEAAKILDCPVGTIRSRVSRARADLAALLSQQQSLESEQDQQQRARRA
ncbi:MAG: RNA polymerase sigma factor [Actinobacteria bacterium]|nr:RNA polymerase sigma factor [Actinomycetota bacterium]